VPLFVIESSVASVPPHADAGIEREILLATDLLVEAVEDAGKLEHRASARFGVEDPGRVRGLSGRPQGPGGHAAPGDGGRVADGCLESERRIGLLRRRDEMTAADLEGLARILLVAGEVYGDPAVPQDPSVVERA